MVRLHQPLLSEYTAYHASHISGCAHAGTGAIAGPIIGAAVILPNGFYHEVLCKPKKPTLAESIHLYGIIHQQAVAWSIATVDHEAIHIKGIPNAAQLSIYNALAQLKTLPDFILVAGQSFDGYQAIPHQCIPKGEKVYLAIAAANLLAKIYRHRYMEKLDKDFPAYSWKKNKGYATPAHKHMIKKLGFTVYHRKNFSGKNH